MEKDVLQYTIVRSGRRTVALEIRPDGGLLVRAPRRMPEAAIRAFVASRREWVERHRTAMAQRQRELTGLAPFTAEELEALAARARRILPERAEHFASVVGVRYGRITVRCQRTRWGSCSGKGNMSFNCLLMLAPDRVRDYVVVHELCHRKYMDHSARFWAEVERVMPDWRDSRRWLRENGALLLARLEASGAR